MTKDEALDLALEALDWISRVNAMDYEYQQKAKAAITAIKQARALDKKADNARELGLDYEPVREDWGPGPHEVHSLPAPTVQEPFCFFYVENGEEYFAPKGAYVPDNAQPLYTTPPAAKRPFVGLTDEEAEELRIQKEFDKWGITEGAFKYAVRDIEAKLRSKNNG